MIDSKTAKSAFREGYGHFFQGWGVDSAPMILDPWKYGYTSNRNTPIYSECSQFFFDNEYLCRDYASFEALLADEDEYDTALANFVGAVPSLSDLA